MSGEFKPVPLTKLPIDANKHVRYVDGMVLGVDDLEQEFAYLSERDKLLVRLLAGYGAVRGLRVFGRNAGTEDAEVVVSAGLGITPSGDVLRVPVDQCANLKDWIEGSHVATPGAGDERTLEAYITAEYTTRTSDPVPIPGEPCRTEGEILADSRVADAFRLELSTVAPAQPEEDAATAYLAWLDALPTVETGGTATGDLLTGILRAAWQKADGTTGAPPAPVGTNEQNVFGSHPQGPGGAPLQLDRATALLARLAALGKIADVRALSAVLEGTVTGALPQTLGTLHTKLLLAKVQIPVVRASPTSEVFLPKSGPGAEITVDTSAAPRLLSLRFMMRAALAGVERLARSAVTVAPGGSSRYVLAAAGQITVAANEAAAAPVPGSIGGLRAWVSGASEVTVKFDGLGVESSRYVVKVLPGRLAGVSPQVHLGAFDAVDHSRFTLSAAWTGGPADAAGLSLSVEIGAVVD